MEIAADFTQEIPVIDQRILAALEGNDEHLGLTQWLEQYITAIEDSVCPALNKSQQ
jgi:hypothetical protein